MLTSKQIFVTLKNLSKLLTPFKCLLKLYTKLTKFLWDKDTPFGFPVEPDVYIIYALEFISISVTLVKFVLIEKSKEDVSI